MESMRVVVIGAGYVGLTTGMALAHVGHFVHFIDTDSSKISLLREGRPPFHEPGLVEMLEMNVQRTSFHEKVGEFVGGADVIMVAVGTPPKASGEADTSFVEEAATEVTKYLREGTNYTIVIKSTVPIGTNHKIAELIRRLLKKQKIETHVHVASNPEFLREGRALRDALYPDRIVVGAFDPIAAGMLRKLYLPILNQDFQAPPSIPRPNNFPSPQLITTDPASSEMIKYAANAFLATKISYINEIAGLCEKVGADIIEVSRGVGLDPRIGPDFLNAGLGWGGSCFPKDTLAMLSMGSEFGYEMPIVEATRTVNYMQRANVIRKLQQELGPLRGKTVGILGLAFKPGTDDVRDAPALDVIRKLLELGAYVRVHDPVALGNAREVLGSDADLEYCNDAYDVAEEADALVLATEWPEYKQLSLERLIGAMRRKLIIDGRNFLPSGVVRELGCKYVGMGRRI